MKKQKVCIIGGGLTGLATSITLSRLNLDVDLISATNIHKNIKTQRTTAISQNNYDYLKKLKLSNNLIEEFWPCQNMKLYTDNNNKKFSKIFEIKKNDKEPKKMLYMIENSTFLKLFSKNIKKNKSINLKNKIKISAISNSGLLKSVMFKKKNHSKYNLIIICTGGALDVEKNKIKDNFFESSYDEFSITTIIKHSSCKNNIARQIFLDNEILALLPISNNKTSVVCSVKKNLTKKYKNNNNLLFKKKIKFYGKKFLNKIKFISEIEFKDLNLLIRKKYFSDRVLFFGDALHRVHPLTGQGFNMVLRDLSSLEKILKNKLNLGLDIGSSEILEEFSKKTKPRNFAYSMGIDFIRNCFSVENKSFKKLRNNVIIKLNKSSLAKDIFYKFADKGFRF